MYKNNSKSYTIKRNLLYAYLLQLSLHNQCPKFTLKVYHICRQLHKYVNVNQSLHNKYFRTLAIQYALVEFLGVNKLSTSLTFFWKKTYDLDAITIRPITQHKVL